jgi:hypothetical protein
MVFLCLIIVPPPSFKLTHTTWHELVIYGNCLIRLGYRPIASNKLQIS